MKLKTILIIDMIVWVAILFYDITQNDITAVVKDYLIVILSAIILDDLLDDLLD